MVGGGGQSTPNLEFFFTTKSPPFFLFSLSFVALIWPLYCAPEREAFLKGKQVFHPLPQISRVTVTC